MAAELAWDDLDVEVQKGILAGAAGGLVASFAMNQFQALLARLKERDGDGGGSSGDDATVKTAVKISDKVLHRELTEAQKKIAGPVVHYAFGTATGAFYGGLAEVSPEVTRGLGLPFGAAVWLAADEVAVPAFGLSKKPTEYPVSVHASALGAHLVYGLVAELARRLLRRTMG